MPKINVDSAYVNHPKTRRLKTYCGTEADIYPIRLWTFCAEYFPENGVLKGYSASEVEGILGWTGPGGNLIRALEQVGFVDRCDESYCVHDWKEHAGFVWSYKKSGRKGGVISGKSRRKKASKQPFKGNAQTLEAKTQNPSTIELNGMELNRDKDIVQTSHKKFIRPSFDELKTYCQERRNGVDPRQFLDFYESKGWVVGKSPMKDWRAAVRTWERNNPAPATAIQTVENTSRMDAKKAELERLKEKEWAKRVKSGDGNPNQDPPWPPPFTLPALKTSVGEH